VSGPASSSRYCATILATFVVFVVATETADTSSTPSAADLRANYPQFFWKVVRADCTWAIILLTCSALPSRSSRAFALRHGEPRPALSRPPYRCRRCRCDSPSLATPSGAWSGPCAFWCGPFKRDGRVRAVLRVIWALWGTSRVEWRNVLEITVFVDLACHVLNCGGFTDR